MSVICNCGPLFSELEDCLLSIFIPALFGFEVSSANRHLFLLPLREGDLGIFNPTTINYLTFFVSSLQSTIFLRHSILQQ